MRLIAITLPYIWSEEAACISQMLDSGEYWRVHIRKPDCKPKEVANLIEEIPERLRQSLTIHYYPELALCLGLGGVHLNTRLNNVPEGWGGLVSRSCHSLEELSLPADYRFLSPVFDSISKPGYLSAFTEEDLRGHVDADTFALGGVTPDKLELLEQLGFGGAAMLGAAWKK